jgi:hypothetical protein
LVVDITPEYFKQPARMTRVLSEHFRIEGLIHELAIPGNPSHSGIVQIRKRHRPVGKLATFNLPFQQPNHPSVPIVHFDRFDHLTLTGLLLLMAAIAPAADMTGTWAGSFKYNEQDVPIRVALKGDSEITGTVDGLPGGTAQIKDGKLQGDSVTFWITIDYQGNPVKLVYKGKVAGDEIKFDFGTEDGSWGAQIGKARPNLHYQASRDISSSDHRQEAAQDQTSSPRRSR